MDSNIQTKAIILGGYCIQSVVLKHTVNNFHDISATSLLTFYLFCFVLILYIMILITNIKSIIAKNIIKIIQVQYI